MTEIEGVANEMAMPVEELRKLLAIPYRSNDAVLPRPIGLRNLGFAKDEIQAIRNELDADLTITRADGQKNVNHAFRLILCNLVGCVFSREPLSVSGSNSAYVKGAYYPKLFLTYDATQRVLSALQKHGYLKATPGNKASKRVNSYEPTAKLELKILPLLYSTVEEYDSKGEGADLVIFTAPKVSKKKKNSKEQANKEVEEHTMWRRYPPEPLPPDHPDLVALKRINEALEDCTYALKSPVKRIYSHYDPMKGGRLYTRLQSLPDRRARIRVNTRLNGEPIAEVDLSSNHPRMLLALRGLQLSSTFYDEVSEATNTSRQQVKFLLMKAIGASDRRISLKPKGDEKSWYDSEFVVSPIERKRIEAHLAATYPELYLDLYRGLGIHLQCLEGDILMTTMLALLDEGIPSLPIHDAIYVQEKFTAQAREAIEQAWMHVLQVDFRPFTTVDSA